MVDVRVKSPDKYLPNLNVLKKNVITIEGSFKDLFILIEIVLVMIDAFTYFILEMSIGQLSLTIISK